MLPIFIMPPPWYVLRCLSVLPAAKKVNAALAEISVIHNKIFLESFWADLDEVMQLKDCEVCSSEEAAAMSLLLGVRAM